MRRPLFVVSGIVAVGALGLTATGGSAQPSAAGGGRRVAVVAVGDDLGRVATLQATVSSGLDRDEALSVVPLLRVADRIGVVDETGAVPETDAARVKALEAHLEEAYYTDNLAEVFKSLDELESLVQQHPFGLAGVKETIHLWRTAAYVSRDDAHKAEASARQLLHVSPSVEIDMSVFTPTMARTVDQVRKEGIRTARVRVAAPQGATVLADGKPLHDGELPIGRHALTWSRKGLRTVQQEIDVRQDTFVNVPTALNLSPAVGRGLESIVWRGQVTPSDRSGVLAIADALQVDVLVLAATRNDPTPEFRAYVWDREGDARGASPPMAATSDGARALVAFVSGRIAAGRRALPTPTPIVRRPHSPKPLVVSARAGAGITSRQRSLTDGSHSLDGRFVGAGPAATVELRRGWIVSDVSARTIFFGLSPVRVPDPDNTNEKVNIGSGFSARVDLGVGGRIELGSREREQRAAIHFLAAAYYEQHNAKEVIASGADTGLFPSYTRYGLGPRVVARAPIGDAVVFTACGQLNLLRGYSEDPARSGDVRVGPDLGWGAVVDWSPGDPWTVSLVYDGQYRSVAYSGISTIPVQPPLQDPKRTESFHTGAVMISRKF